MNEPDDQADLRDQDFATRLADMQQDFPPAFQKCFDDIFDGIYELRPINS